MGADGAGATKGKSEEAKGWGNCKACFIVVSSGSRHKDKSLEGQHGFGGWAGLTPSWEEALESIAAEAERMRKRGRDPYAVSGME